MKKIYLLFATTLLLLLSSCSVNDDYTNIPPPINEPDYSYILQNFDLWEVDHSLTTGPSNSSVPFIDRAITLSFFDRILYANNNFSGFGITGNGFGIPVASYVLGYNTISINHDVYGRFTLELIFLGQNKILLYDRNQGVSYTLFGYNKSNYDYDYVFFNNIEFFLQEFNAWRKISTTGGSANLFDDENFLGFDTSGSVFHSSIDNVNTPIDFLQWNFSGIYSISNTVNPKRKVLSLDYGNSIERFELIHVNDNTIDLYHYASSTTYTFQGQGYIQFLRPQLKTLSRKSGN